MKKGKSYYHNIAQPLTKKDFEIAIKAMKKSKVKYPKPSPIVMPLGYEKVLKILESKTIKELSKKKG